MCNTARLCCRVKGKVTTRELDHERLRYLRKSDLYLNSLAVLLIEIVNDFQFSIANNACVLFFRKQKIVYVTTGIRCIITEKEAEN